MVLGYNILDHFETQSLQRYQWADNVDIMTVLTTGVIPAFVLISDTSQANGTASGALQMYDASDDSTIGSAKDVVISTSGSYKQVKYTGTTGVSATDKCVYYKITLTGQTTYSEVFRWGTDYTDMLKVVCSSMSNLTLGGTYEIDMSSITWTSYYPCERSQTTKNITESGAEKPYGDIPVFNTRNLINEFDILGGREAFKYLSGLRILETNSTIVFTFNNVAMTAYDIHVEEQENYSLDEAIDMTLSFKETNYISSRNTI